VFTIAICDHEIAYIEKFKEFIAGRTAKHDIRLYTFTSVKLLSETLQEKSFDIVFIGKGYNIEFENEKYNNTLFLYLSDSLQIENQMKEFPVIYKYQSGEDLLREAFHRYQESINERIEIKLFRGKKELIGIYSPSHSLSQSPFALTLAHQSSHDKRVLYVNFGECAGFSQWFMKEFTKDLGDLLYMLSTNANNFHGKLASVIYTMEQFDYIPPISDPQLLCETGAEEYLLLIRYLMEKTEYETVILDFGIMIPGFFSLLEQCTTVYLTRCRDPLTKGPKEHFLEAAKRAGRGELASRMQDIVLPDMSIKSAQEPILQQWIWGSVGEAVRKIFGEKYGSD